MNLFEITIKALNTSAFVYLAACFSFIIALSRAAPLKKERWTKISSWLVLLGFALHTFGLAGRWYIGGIGRPPWTNLYESLLAFSWGLVIFQVVLERKWKLPLLGAITIPLVFILMGMSVMTPNKSVEPLIPALQSNWLKIHVLFGVTSYAGFTVSACFGFLHLMRKGVSLSRIGAGLALMTLVNLSIAGGEEVFKDGHFYMAKTVMRQLPDGTQVKTKDTYREYEGGPVITRMEPVPVAHVPFWISYAAFALAAGLLWFRRRKPDGADMGDDPTPDQAVASGQDLDFVSYGVFGVALVALLAFFGSIWAGIHASESLTLSSNPYLTMLLVTTAFFCIMFMLIQRRYQRFLTALPTAPQLDEFSYKNILFAFPFQTLLLVTGAVWAYYAWGRSWGWDPKETWALITWFVYLIYLHGKLLMRWTPTLLSVIAIAGFVVLVFAFLGVNLVLSGLHSYGAA
jgi:ABC-type transport system involved in cytochrome c biogenesis permease subunit